MELFEGKYSTLNHRFFRLRKEHVGMMKSLIIDPESLSLIGDNIDDKSPFSKGGSLLNDLGYILVGKELSDKEKEKKNELGEKYLTRDNPDELLAIFNELPLAIEVVFSSLSFEPGLYRTRHYYSEWTKIEN